MAELSHLLAELLENALTFSPPTQSVELHTFFQLPLSQYPATHGSRTQRALHALVFTPGDGLIAAMLDLEARGEIERRDGELHFLDVRAHAHRPG